MKKTLPFLIFFLIIMYSSKSFSQMDVDLVDIKNKKTISFYDIYDTYKLKKETPLLIITWSGKWCPQCIELIDRYNKCDLTMLNVITVNIDAENSVEEVLKEGSYSKWNKTLNFHANIGKDKKGFDDIFNVTTGPLLIYIENGKISDAVVDYNFFPYKFVQSGLIFDYKFIWNSWQDLNSLAWSYYQNLTETDKLEAAKNWIIRSMELDKNYYNTDTYAALLFKTGDYTKALKIAKEAIEIAKAKSIDYASTTDLINKIIEKL